MGRVARVLWLALLALALTGCVFGGGSRSDTDLAADALNRGLKAHNAGNYAEARTAYFETLYRDPTNKFAFFNLGQIAQTQRKNAIAEGYYRSALETDARFGPALYNLAILRAEAGAKTEAIDMYRRTIQADANNAAAYFNLGLLLRDTGNTAEANQMFVRAQQLDPKLVPPPSPSPTR